MIRFISTTQRRRARALSVLLVALATASGAFADPLARPELSREFLLAARAEPLTPHEDPPEWLDWERAKRGIAFESKNSDLIGRTRGSLSLLESYASNDALPIVLGTGALAEEFAMRLRQTGRAFGEMTRPRSEVSVFLKRNYRRAVRVGRYHNELIEEIAPELDWDETSRVLFNQQSYAYTVLLFTWLPATKVADAGRVDLEGDRSSLEDYLHLWSALAYAMGVREELLPYDVDRAQELWERLRPLQLAGPRESPTEGQARLYRGLMGSLEDRFGDQFGETSEERRRAIAGFLGSQVESSPGLAAALGLGTSVQKSLIEVWSSSEESGG